MTNVINMHNSEAAAIEADKDFVAQLCATWGKLNKENSRDNHYEMIAFMKLATIYWISIQRNKEAAEELALLAKIATPWAKEMEAQESVPKNKTANILPFTPTNNTVH